uniref:protein-serine/threonine phosphatase n=1 Tax=Steinernema glaseri TaxID=37863 RepID=A0A1I7XZ84_9BILA
MLGRVTFRQLFHKFFVWILSKINGKKFKSGQAKLPEVTDKEVSAMTTRTESHIGALLQKEAVEGATMESGEPMKPILLIDLDHTLIHSTNNLQDHPMSDSIFTIPGRMVKIRPYCQEFLETMSKLYEMHVTTLSSRTYALTIVEHLDPEGRFFSGRVISRDEFGSRKKKHVYFTRLFPESLPFAAILDNRSDVWDEMENVVQLSSYRYFRKQGQADEDQSLKHMARVLTEVHDTFQSHFQATGEHLDMRDVIGAYRRKVLEGVKVVVSAEAPWVTKGASIYAKKIACEVLRRFGAEVQDTMDQDTSVIVELWDRKRRVPGTPVVWSSWLDAVSSDWEIPDYGKHLLSY